jgi:hypothetical protein
VRQLHAAGRLRIFVDCHAHSNKRGCFLYGNALPEQLQLVEAVTYAKLVEQNCRWFDFEGCTFSQASMSAKEPRDGGGAGKEGSGRVGVYRATGLAHAFTLECNYNTGRVVNRIAHPHSEGHASLSPQPPLRCLSPKYTPAEWNSVGKARRPPRCNPMCPTLQPHVPQAATPCAPGCNPMCPKAATPCAPRLQPRVPQGCSPMRIFPQALFLAALDLHGANPCSRLGAPGEMAAAGLARLRSTSAAWVRSAARAAKEKSAKRLAKKAADGNGGRTGSAGGSGSGGNGSDDEDDKEEDPVDADFKSMLATMRSAAEERAPLLHYP